MVGGGDPLDLLPGQGPLEAQRRGVSEFSLRLAVVVNSPEGISAVVNKPVSGPKDASKVRWWDELCGESLSEREALVGDLAGCCLGEIEPPEGSDACPCGDEDDSVTAWRPDRLCETGFLGKKLSDSFGLEIVDLKALRDHVLFLAEKKLRAIFFPRREIPGLLADGGKRFFSIGGRDQDLLVWGDCDDPPVFWVDASGSDFEIEGDRCEAAARGSPP